MKMNESQGGGKTKERGKKKERKRDIVGGDFVVVRCFGRLFMQSMKMKREGKKERMKD